MKGEIMKSVILMHFDGNFHATIMTNGEVNPYDLYLEFLKQDWAIEVRLKYGRDGEDNLMQFDCIEIVTEGSWTLYATRDNLEQLRNDGYTEITW